MTIALTCAVIALPFVANYLYLKPKFDRLGEQISVLAQECHEAMSLPEEHGAA